MKKIEWINGPVVKTVSVRGVRTIVGHWNLYLGDTQQFVTLSPEQIRNFISIGPKQRYCYADLLDVEIAFLFGVEMDEIEVKAG